VDPFCEGSPIDRFMSEGKIEDETTIRQILEKWLFLGDERNIHQVYVSGHPSMSNLMKYTF